MPNGGTDNCGECVLFSKKYELTVSDKDET